MTKATDNLEALALKAAVQLHCHAATHRSRAEGIARRLTGLNARCESQADVDHELAKAEENEALYRDLSAAVIDVRIQRQMRAHRRAMK